MLNYKLFYLLDTLVINMGEDIERNGYDVLNTSSTQQMTSFNYTVVFQHCIELQPSELKNHSFRKYFLLAFYVQGTVLSTKDTEVSKMGHLAGSVS